MQQTWKHYKNNTDSETVKLTDRLRPNMASNIVWPFFLSFLLANGLKWQVDIQQQLATAVTLVELVILLFRYQILIWIIRLELVNLVIMRSKAKQLGYKLVHSEGKNFSPGCPKDRTYESRTELELERCLRWKRRLKPELCDQIWWIWETSKHPLFPWTLPVLRKQTAPY